MRWRIELERGRRWLRIASVLTLFCLAGGVRVGAQPDEGRRSPLQEAILAGEGERVRELIADGTILDEALITASRVGSLEYLDLLVAAGANTTGFFGARALAVALVEEHEEVQAFLERHGADLEARDEAGRTVLVWASGQKRLGPLVRAALRGGAELEAASRLGETALMTAARHGRVGTVRTLLTAGAEVDAVDRDGWTALMHAIRSGSPKIVGLLLRAGSDYERESALGWTPLMLAVRDRQVPIVNRLLRHGADPNRQTELRSSPLVGAVQWGGTSLVRRLVAAGADPGSGETGDALWWARRLGRRRVASLLVGRPGGPS